MIGEIFSIILLLLIFWIIWITLKSFTNKWKEKTRCSNCGEGFQSVKKYCEKCGEKQPEGWADQNKKIQRSPPPYIGESK